MVAVSCAQETDQLGALAGENGWSGIVVNSCIRNSKVLGLLDLGIKALNTYRGESETKSGSSLPNGSHREGLFQAALLPPMRTGRYCRCRA